MNNIDITNRALINNDLRELAGAFRVVVNREQHVIKVMKAQYKGAIISNNYAIRHLESLRAEITEPEASHIINEKIMHLRALNEEMQKRIDI